MLSIFKKCIFICKKEQAFYHCHATVLLSHLAKLDGDVVKSRAIFITKISDLCRLSSWLDILLHPFILALGLALTSALQTWGRPCLLCGTCLCKVIKQQSWEFILAHITDEETKIRSCLAACLRPPSWLVWTLTWAWVSSRAGH